MLTVPQQTVPALRRSHPGTNPLSRLWPRPPHPLQRGHRTGIDQVENPNYKIIAPHMHVFIRLYHTRDEQSFIYRFYRHTCMLYSGK